MRRTLAVVAMFVGCLSAPTSSAQDGRQFLEGILGGAVGEIERRQQQRREKKLARQLEPLWTACAAGDVSACHSAAQFPLNDHARAVLQDNLQRAIAQREAFERNSFSCQRGTVEACEAALAYPFATNHDALTIWRDMGIELQKQQREAVVRERKRIAGIVARCRAGDLSSCDLAIGTHALSAEERAQVVASRAAILNQQAVLKRPAENGRSPREPQRASAATDPTEAQAHTASRLPPAASLLILLASILAGALLVIRPRDLLSAGAPFIESLSSLLHPRAWQAHQEPRAMLDDRDALVGAMRSTAGSPPLPPYMDHVRVMRPGQDQMKIKIRRDQVTGITGKVSFTVNFIAELSPEAREAVHRYGFGKTVLYQKNPKLEMSMNIFRLLWRMLWLRLTRKRWQINVNDLVHGRTIQCKDILEVLDVEERIMGAAKSFGSVLRAASWFGGEEIVAL